MDFYYPVNPLGINYSFGEAGRLLIGLPHLLKCNLNKELQYYYLNYSNNTKTQTRYKILNYTICR